MFKVRIAVPLLWSAVFLLAASSPPAPEAPKDQYLIHIFMPWQYPPPEIRKENHPGQHQRPSSSSQSLATTLSIRAT
jgi:hypothetical protein